MTRTFRRWRRRSFRKRRPRRSHLTRVQLIRTDLWWLRGRVQLAALAAGTTRGTSFRTVEVCARRLDREGLDHCRAKVALLRAGAAHLRGDEERCADRLMEAERGFAASEMGLLESVAKLRRGSLLGGSQGEALRAEAGAFFHAQQVAQPERMAALWAPGWG